MVFQGCRESHDRLLREGHRRARSAGRGASAEEQVIGRLTWLNARPAGNGRAAALPLYTVCAVLDLSASRRLVLRYWMLGHGEQQLLLLRPQLLAYFSCAHVPGANGCLADLTSGVMACACSRLPV